MNKTILGQDRTRDCCRVRIGVVTLDSLEFRLSKLRSKPGKF